MDDEAGSDNRADVGSGLGLRSKLVLSLLPMVLVAFAVTWTVATTSARRGLEAASMGGLSTEVKGLAGSVSATFADSLSDAQMIAHLDISAATLESKDPKGFRWLADQMVTTKKRYAALVLADLQGKIIATNSIDLHGGKLPTIEGSSLGKEPWAITKATHKPREQVAVPAGRPGFLAGWLKSDRAAGFHLQVTDVVGDLVGTLTVLVSLDAVAASLDGAVSSPAGDLRSREAWMQRRVSNDGEDVAGARAFHGPAGERFFVVHEPLVGAVGDWGWRLSGMRAAEIVDAPVLALTRVLSLVFGVCSVLLTALIIFLASRIVAPIRRLVAAATGAETNGRLTTAPVESSDEVGVLTKAFNDMVKALNTDLGNHMRHISASSAQLLQSANQLNHTSSEMSQSSKQTSGFAGVARGSIQDFVTSMRVVSEGTRALTKSIGYVAENAHGAQTAVEEAVRSASNANDVMNQLHQRSQEVEEVLKVIGAVANQTKLLSLNATIEATRAGEYGHGFGVVAQEVKDLARRVSISTDDIARRMDAMRADTARAMEAVRGFSGVIEKVNEISQSLSSTAEEQLATTRDIHRSVEGAASSATLAEENIASLVHSAEHTTRGADDTGRAAEGLLRMASDLQGLTTAMRLAPQEVEGGAPPSDTPERAAPASNSNGFDARRPMHRLH